MTPELETIAQDCVLRSANSQNPRRVLAQHFEKAYQLGIQAGIRMTAEALDKVAGETK